MAGQTAIQESAQALFCAVADYLGAAETKKSFNIDKFPTYKDFYTQVKGSSTKNINEILNESFKKYVDAPGVTLKTIEDLFTKDNDWYRSSVNIAKKLMEEVETIDKDFSKIKKVNWSDIFYVRGDKKVMGNIAILFKRANEMLKKEPLPGVVPFGDINKWSPADIYFASESAYLQIENKVKVDKHMSFPELNKFISDLINAGDLLPLSLKKQPNDVTIKKVNFERKKELDELMKYTYVKATPKERYLEIKINKSDSKAQFSFTHDPSGNVYKASIILSREARGGSISGNIIPDVIKLVDSKFGNEFNLALQKTKRDFAEAKAKAVKGLDKKNRKKYDEVMAHLSKVYVTDKLNKKLVDYLNKSKNADKIIRLWMEYAGSTTSMSGKFVLAK
jgi:hypothetical protein